MGKKPSRLLTVAAVMVLGFVVAGCSSKPAQLPQAPAQSSQPSTPSATGNNQSASDNGKLVKDAYGHLGEIKDLVKDRKWADAAKEAGELDETFDPLGPQLASKDKKLSETTEDAIHDLGRALKEASPKADEVQKLIDTIDSGLKDAAKVYNVSL